MKRTRRWRMLTLLLASAGSALADAAVAGEMRVVATIKPVHALVAGVMEGVSTPFLLIEGGGSPHAYALRPSDARALSMADLVVWVGPGLETFLAKPLEALAPDAHRLTLSELSDLVLLPVRIGPTWSEHQRLAPEGEADEHAPGAYDMHIWLDPDNAERIAAAVATALAALDPANADAYRRNAGTLDSRLEALGEELDQALAGVRGVPYVVFHDAYRYFERRYGMNVVGAVTASPDQPPGAGRVVDIRRTMVAAGARCLFHEPGLRPRLVRTLVEGTGAAIDVLDPLGAELAPGPELYFSLMRGLSANLERCLSAPRP